MTTATMFSRQNDAASRASTTYYWENLVLVVVLVLESRGLYYINRKRLTSGWRLLLKNFLQDLQARAAGDAQPSA